MDQADVSDKPTTTHKTQKSRKKPEEEMSEADRLIHRQDESSWHDMSSMISRVKVKESDLPIDLLYNDTLNEIKDQEKEEGKMPKPITFSTTNDPDRNAG